MRHDDDKQVMNYVIWDLDGVWYPWTHEFAFYVNHFTNHSQEVSGDVTEYAFWDEWGMTKEEWLYHFDRSASQFNVFKSGVPMADTSAWRALRVPDIMTLVVTARPDVARLHTAEWLHKYGLDYDHLAISHDKVATAQELIELNPDYEVGAVITIEDHVKNFDAYAEAGYESYLLSTTWNQECKTDRRLFEVEEFPYRVRDAVQAQRELETV